MAQSVNFDAAAGLPLSPAGRAALLAALDRGWADPRRLYHGARVSRQLLDAARAAVAAVLGTASDRVVFTDSGTAAIGVGLRGLVLANRRARGGAAGAVGVVTSAVEHSAVLGAADDLTDGRPTLVPVDAAGVVDITSLADAVTAPDVAAAALQQVNPEIGTVQPLASCHAATQLAGVPLLVDACAGLPVLGPPQHWDALAVSSHKWGGPAGVGILALAPGVRWRAPAGVAAEGGFPNVAGAVAAAAALEDSIADLDQRRRRHQELMLRLRAGVVGGASDVLVLGPSNPDLACGSILALTVLYADGQTLVEHLDRAGFAVASGSACTSDTRRPSHVLVAMGAVTHGNIRISLAPQATDEQVTRFLEVFPAAVRAARAGTGWDIDG